MLADPLTKAGRSGEELLNCVRSGSIAVPGGMEIQRSAKLNSSTWKRLVQSQSKAFDEEDLTLCTENLGPMTV